MHMMSWRLPRVSDDTYDDVLKALGRVTIVHTQLEETVRQLNELLMPPDDPNRRRQESQGLGAKLRFLKPLVKKRPDRPWAKIFGEWIETVQALGERRNRALKSAMFYGYTEDVLGVARIEAGAATLVSAEELIALAEEMQQTVQDGANLHWSIWQALDAERELEELAAAGGTFLVDLGPQEAHG